MIRNENVDFNLSDKIFSCSINEFNTLQERLHTIVEVTGNLIEKLKTSIVSETIESTHDVKPSLFFKGKYLIDKELVIVDLPYINSQGVFYHNGHKLLTEFQSLQKPLIKTKNGIMLKTNGYYMTIETEKMKVTNSVGYGNCNAMTYFLNVIGKEKFMDITGVKIVDDNVDISNIKDDFNNDLFLKLLTFKVEKNVNKGFLWDCEALEKTTNIDIFSKNFFKTETASTELLRGFTNSFNVESGTQNKSLSRIRIRSYERFLVPFISHLMANAFIIIRRNKLPPTKKTVELSLSSNIRESYANINSGNELFELTVKTKMTLLGRYGRSQKKFRGASRNISEDQYGTVCPITTPERERCGIVNYLALSKCSDFNKIYKW